MFVLGVDPGLSRCGYGAVERRGRAERAVAAGIISTSPQDPVPQRLAELQREMRALIAELRPDVVAIERVLFSVNVRTAMAVGQASGIVMAEAVTAGCVVVEYSPNEVKEAVAGWGGAGKQEVGQMVQTLLGLERPLRPADAADAVAIALCHLARTPGRRSARPAAEVAR
ncbi:MAG: crossover junction endodeoxyribonuclease RuvC [Acidimicrobiales bacterium]|jgi:crossover junction endodeoxyribonuclease RuvC|nr:crossover junction endodeoxyribonuclease RuvC [Acidimicrobiales bacterium]